MPKLIIHLEGLCVLLFSLYFYSYNDFSWLVFFVLLFSPDLSALGYLVNNRIGALCYNLFHTYILVFVLLLLGIVLSYDLLKALGLIFAAHIGMDRAIGYGLKYPNEFKETHFQKL